LSPSPPPRRQAAARALVTDVEERAALAVCRGLAAAGYAVTGVAGTRPAAGHWSRSVADRVLLPHPAYEPVRFVEQLAALVERRQHDVLVPSVEASLLAVSEHRDLLEPHVRLGLPPHDVVRHCLDKLALFEVAEREGLAPPESVVCNTTDEAAAAGARLGYPLLVKPGHSLVREDGRKLASTLAHDERELRALAPRFPPPFAVQKRERGPVVSCGGTFAGGRLLGLCVSRYERTWPATGGAASASVTIDPPTGLGERLEQLLRALAWEGIFELELVETADGRLAAIDFNPRPYGSLALATAAGANLAALWCDYVRGVDPPAVRARAGLGYRWEEAELHNLSYALRRRDLAAVAALVRPLPTTNAFFRPSDPAPIVARAISVVQRRRRG
jgi:predicted ATP-grasp superfamily ATP-dependent carboligase